MTEKEIANDIERQVRQAVVLWVVFVVVLVIINGTILFVLGIDLHDWTSSTAKVIILSAVCYAGLFLVAPLILVKGWETVRRPEFLAPLLVAVSGIILWTIAPLAAALVVVVWAYLHWRFDLSKVGMRSSGWRKDMAAIVFLGLLQLPVVFVHSGSYLFSPLGALIAGLNRWFANPASTVENLFYFGFMAERLSYKTGKWLTPPLIGAMYTVHEMSNPEYWYGGWYAGNILSFALTFIGITIITVVYLWRRSVVVIWLGDGLGRLVSNLFQLAS